ncbi:MAG: hypothetical protein IJ068_06485 [Bacilli bacterium]|nr:hypothetical protein [Bacilli bacterium]
MLKKNKEKRESRKEKKERKKSITKFKKKEKEKKVVDKGTVFKRRFKFVLIISILIIAIELIIMYLMNVNKNNNLTFVDTYNSVRSYDDYYIASGASNFKYSRYNDSFIYEYTDTNVEGEPKREAYAEQAKLVKYDKELNTIFESTFMGDYDSTFYDAISVGNDIYAVGSYIYEESQISLRTRDGLFVKYNENGEMEWFKNFQVLGDTEFKRIMAVDDGFIVVGQSIYENMEIGNHATGGGIIIKYDMDGNIVWNNNFGGNKSGIFNDVVKVDDGYICVGKDAVNYGLIVKFSLDGELVWIKNYANTDEFGMSKVALHDNKLYIAGAYNKSKEKNDSGEAIFEYDACIFVYDLNGEFIELYSIGGNKSERFNSLLLTDDSIIAVGYTKSDDIDINGLNYRKDKIEGMIVSFDYKGNILNKKTYGGTNNESLNDITLSIPDTSDLINNTNSYIAVGYSNSKRGVFTGNGKDFFSKIIRYSTDLNILEEK